ncbi:MAG: hypothetical protein P8K10_01530 [Crocinitomicaceae bacterium]|nr:hypothetical protein [Crocinitomicaceae bacterium]
MRILSFIGLGLGAIAIFLALYLHFEIAPQADGADAAIQRKMNSNTIRNEVYYAEIRSLNEVRSQKTDYGQYTLLLGGLSFLVSIFPAVKRNKFAIIGASLGLISFFIGAAYGTHMFS